MLVCLRFPKDWGQAEYIFGESDPHILKSVFAQIRKCRDHLRSDSFTFIHFQQFAQPLNRNRSHLAFCVCQKVHIMRDDLVHGDFRAKGMI